MFSQKSHHRTSVEPPAPATRTQNFTDNPSPQQVEWQDLEFGVLIYSRFACAKPLMEFAGLREPNNFI